ncbi:MAG: hypothetical protein ACK5C8_10525 [Roseiflexaceae bacterium]|jgi:hypothetical protein|nr:hypothetical protein [Chloroflexaceae bacterium]
MIALRTFWLSCKDFFEEMFLSIFANALWCIMVAPLALLVYQNMVAGFFAGALLLGIAVFILFVVANGALSYLARRVVDGLAVSWRDLITGMRINFGKRVAVHAVWAGVLLTCVFNMWFYGNTAQIPSNIAVPLIVLFFDLTLLWVIYLAFLLPVLARQPDSSLGMIFRNAAGLMFTNAFASLLMLVIASLLFVISALLLILLLLFFAIIMAYWSTHMTDAAIKVVLDRQAAQTESDATNERAPSGQVRPK